MMEEEILFHLDKDNVGTLILNRPHVHNALNQTMIQKLLTLFQDLHQKPSIRALILKGNGKSFCAGADISWMKDMSACSHEENQQASRTLASMLSHLDTLPFPTLSFAQGSIMGGGLGLLACSDIVISDTLSSFSFSEVKIGLSPSIIAPYVIRSLGIRQARRYFLTGEKFSAPRAQDLGLVHEIVDHQAESVIEQFIQNILRGGPMAIRATKELIRDIDPSVTQEMCLKTAEHNATLRASEECQEGLKAFLEKRTPSWISMRDLTKKENE